MKKETNSQIVMIL